MGIDVTQWRIEIARYVKFVGRRRHGRGKSPGGKAASATSCSPLLALLLSFCLITAPSLLLQAGDVERNPGPPKIQTQDVLTIDDLNDVLSELYGVKAKWRNLGSLLRVNESTLAEISTEPRNFTSIRLRGMLSHWLIQVEPQPSWNAIVAALRSPIMGEQRLAHVLEARYCSGSQAEPAPPPAAAGYSHLLVKRGTIIRLLADLGVTGELTEKLRAAEMISQRIYDEARNFSPGVVEMDRVTVLFNAVLASVKLNPVKYDQFIGILKQIRGSDDLVDFIEARGPEKKQDLDLTTSANQDGDHEKYLAACKEAMLKKGKLNQTIIPCVFVGPPGNGKTSLMRRLIGKPLPPPDKSLPSTGVAEKIVQVDIRRSSSTSAQMNSSVWKELTLDDEGVALLMDISRDQTLESHSNTTSQPSNSPVASANTSATTESQSDFQFSPAATVPPSSFKPPLEMFKDILRTKDWSATRKYLEGACIAHLTDTGGQLEFQELLPALVSGPSVFFLVFRLDRDLNERFTVKYRHPSKECKTTYESSYTVTQFLLHTLASIASMGSYTYKKKHVPLTPKVFFVGTHKDRVTKKAIKGIDRDLFQKIEHTNHYKSGIIQRGSKELLIIPVNNFSRDDSDAQLVRSAVERIRGQGHFDVSAPPQWLIFSLALRKLKESVVTYDECSVVAKQCGIDTLDELNDALGFLSTKVGLIRYFQGANVDEDVQQIVIQDPQVLFDRITNLIIATFTFENTNPFDQEEFTNKGIFSDATFEAISSKEGEKYLTPTRLLKLLQHLHVIAPIQELSDKTKYFMPCILAHAAMVNPKPSVGSCQMTSVSDAPPLLVCFCCGYCPRGLFCALVVYLLNNKMKSRFSWTLECEKIFRDQISFSVGPYNDHVSLTIKPTFIEVKCASMQSQLPRKLDFATVCREVCSAVESGVQTVASTLHYNYDPAGLLKLSFYCPHNHPAEITFLDGVPCSLRCSGCLNYGHGLPMNYEVWFDKCIGATPSLPPSTVPTHPPVSQMKPAGMIVPSLVELFDNVRTTKWFYLGLKLGVKQDDLDIIESDKRLDASEALMAVLRKWLRQCENPTWRAVVQAMREIGEVKKASSLEGKFC